MTQKPASTQYHIATDGACIITVLSPVLGMLYADLVNLKGCRLDMAQVINGTPCIVFTIEQKHKPSYSKIRALFRAHGYDQVSDRENLIADTAPTPSKARFTWEELYGPKPTVLIPIEPGCTVVYSSPSFWGFRQYYGKVTRVQGRRVWVLYPSGEREEYDANLSVVDKDTGYIHVNDTGYTDWEQHYEAARRNFEKRS